MNTIRELRDRYPYRPHDIVILRGADDKVNAPVEVISYPWLENGVARIKIRLVPGDPGTMGETRCDNLKPDYHETWRLNELCRVAMEKGVLVAAKTLLPPALNADGSLKG